jgi:thiol-disulfide isomerase/thioredoxin
MMKRGFVLIVLILVLVAIRYQFSEGFQDSAGPSVVICKATWCGHCKTAAPEFKKLVDASPITLANGAKATVKMLDDAQDKEEIKKYNVRGYPTILIMKGGEPIEYPGERTYDGVVDFLNKM